MVKAEGPRCPFNKEIYDRISHLKLNAKKHNLTNQEFIYGKVLRALEKYPIPILTAAQATNIDNIGPKIANVIDEVVKKKYENFKKNEDSQSMQNSYIQPQNFLSSVKRDDLPFKPNDKYSKSVKKHNFTQNFVQLFSTKLNLLFFYQMITIFLYKSI